MELDFMSGIKENQMPLLSKASLSKLETCHPKLQELIKELSSYVDVTVLCGHRTKKEQNEAYTSGVSKVQYPNSKHNSIPSMAVDVAPYPIDWHDLRRFYYMGGFIIALAEKKGIKVRWGGDWNRNYEIKDNNFNDLPHVELVIGD